MIDRPGVSSSRNSFCGHVRLLSPQALPLLMTIMHYHISQGENPGNLAATLPLGVTSVPPPRCEPYPAGLRSLKMSIFRHAPLANRQKLTVATRPM
jgi:hypothetical protein